jgi:hypothetical protein
LKDKLKNKKFVIDLINNHKSKVKRLVDTIIADLSLRGIVHDNSKFDKDELLLNIKYGKKSMACKFGSKKYLYYREKSKRASESHYKKKKNRHHPEHFKDGINGMTLVDIMEMVLDWRAATENHRVPTSLNVSIEMARKKYSIDDQLVKIIYNTAKYYNLL